MSIIDFDKCPELVGNEQAQANRAAAAAAAGIDGYLMPGEESTVGNSSIITEVWTFGVDQPGAREPPPSHTRDKQDQEASIFEKVKSVLPLSLSLVNRASKSRGVAGHEVSRSRVM